MDSESQAHEVLEVNKDCTRNCAGSHSCNSLAKHPAVFCPCCKIRSETDLRNNKLNCSVEGISSQCNIQGMAWLSLADFFNKTFSENSRHKIEPGKGMDTIKVVGNKEAVIIKDF